MFSMDWSIKVGAYKLNMLESVTIIRSVEQLLDTATIVFPAAAWNQALEVESKITRGDAVEIMLGYDGEFVNEFSGYLEALASDDGTMKLLCEDPIFLYRVALKNKEFTNVTVKQLLDHVNAEVSKYYPNDTPFSLSCDYVFKYDKFTLYNATGYDVLKKIHEEAKPNIYIKDRCLHVHPQYVEIFGKQYYNFAVNIETSELKYKKAEDRKLMITVETKDRKGKVIKVDVGTLGGDHITLKVSGVTDLPSLKALATQALAQRVYTGYEGSFTGWLIPYCDAGWQVRIRDIDYPNKNGSYYVLEVKVEFSKSGGKRIVKVGKKLSDG